MCHFLILSFPLIISRLPTNTVTFFLQNSFKADLSLFIFMAQDMPDPSGIFHIYYYTLSGILSSCLGPLKSIPKHCYQDDSLCPYFTHDLLSASLLWLHVIQYIIFKTPHPDLQGSTQIYRSLYHSPFHFINVDLQCYSLYFLLPLTFLWLLSCWTFHNWNILPSLVWLPIFSSSSFTQHFFHKPYPHFSVLNLIYLI